METKLSTIYIYLSNASKFVNEGRIDAASEQIDKALAIAYEIKEENIDSFYTSLQQKASIERLKGNIEYSDHLYDDLISLLEKSGKELNLANVLVYRALHFKTANNFQQALKALEKTKEILFRHDYFGIHFNFFLTLINKGIQINTDFVHQLYEDALEKWPDPTKEITSVVIVRIRQLQFISNTTNIDKVAKREKAMQLIEFVKSHLSDLNFTILREDLYMFGNFYYDLRDFKQSFYLYDLSLSDLDMSDSIDKKHYFSATRFKANSLLEENNFEEANKLFKECIQFSTIEWGNEDPYTMDVMTDLGFSFKRQGNYVSALDIYERIIEIYQKHLPATDDRLLNALHNAGECLDQTNFYYLAEEYYRRIINTAPKDSLQLPRAYSSLADINKMKGDYKTAEHYFKTALEINKGMSNSFIDNNLGEVYIQLDKLDQAYDLINRAAEKRRLKYAEDSLEYARSVESLISIEIKRKNYSHAKELIAFIEKIYRKYDTPDKLFFCYHSRAQIFADEGDLDSATVELKKCEAILLIKSHEYHLNVVRAREQIFELTAVIDSQKDAPSSWLISYFEKVVTQFELNLIETVRTGSKRSNDEFIHKCRDIFDAIFLIHKFLGKKEISHFYIFTQKLKALESSLLSMRKPGMRGTFLVNFPCEETLEAYASTIERIRQLKNKLNRNVKTTADAVKYLEEKDLIEVQIEELERTLHSGISYKKLEDEISDINTSKIQNRLTENEVLIEYYLAKIDNHYPASVYYAFVITNEDVSLIKLGPAQQIDDAILNLRDRLQHEENNEKRTPYWHMEAKFLYNKLLKPAKTLFDTRKTLLLGCEGVINILPFDILIDEEGGFLIDHFQINFVNSGKEAIRKHYAHKRNKPVVIAGPQFNCPPKINREEHYVVFQELHGAEAEGKALAELLAASLYTGAEAKESIMKALDSPEILHIATHGFFIPSEEDSVRNTPQNIFLNKRSGIEDPLERCGLAFAGANNWLIEGKEYEEEGVLFASEIVDIDLRDTELVVLSACDSGLGDIKPGDVVNGLRKAFFAAGCQGLLFSLWEVPDDITIEFMKVFYCGLLNEESKEVALLKAKHFIRSTYKDPFMWAGFSYIGDRGLLRRFTHPIQFKFVGI